MLLHLHWPEDLRYWVYTGKQPADSHTWLTDSCESWALLQELLSLQLFQRKYLFKSPKVSLWRKLVEGLKRPGGSLQIAVVSEGISICVFRRVMLSLLHHPLFYGRKNCSEMFWARRKAKVLRNGEELNLAGKSLSFPTASPSMLAGSSIQKTNPEFLNLRCNDCSNYTRSQSRLLGWVTRFLVCLFPN